MIYVQEIKYFANKKRQTLLFVFISSWLSCPSQPFFFFAVSGLPFALKLQRPLLYSSLWLHFMRLLLICTVMFHISPKVSVELLRDQLRCSSLILGQCSEQQIGRCIVNFQLLFCFAFGRDRGEAFITLITSFLHPCKPLRPHLPSSFWSSTSLSTLSTVLWCWLTQECTPGDSHNESYHDISSIGFLGSLLPMYSCFPREVDSPSADMALICHGNVSNFSILKFDLLY